MTPEQYESTRTRTLEYFDRAGIVLTAAEAAAIEVADFGLGEIESTGLELVVYVNTERVCQRSCAVPSADLS